ncbi:MAG: NAD(P)H-binding protein, partial [Microcoleus sp. SIO2G3]|nr:NAD(P)H-binding protein [Microcoleus sp. SIO2G3]
MKVAITGATGFVGSRLVDRLQEEGHHVLALTRNATKVEQFPTESFPNIQLVKYTPLESGEWQEAISGCDGVVN